MTGRQQSYPYLPIADVLFTIHVVYSKNRVADLFKICDAKSKITRKKFWTFPFSVVSCCAYGNIHPFERDVPKDSEGDKLNKLIIRHDAALKATLNEQEVEILEKLKDALTEQSSLSECEGFINGFRLGVRLMVESFYDRK